MIASPAIEPISPENDTEGYFELVIRSVHISLNLRSANNAITTVENRTRTDNPMCNNGNKLGNTR